MKKLIVFYLLIITLLSGAKSQPTQHCIEIVSTGLCALEACLHCSTNKLSTGIKNINDPSQCIYMNWSDDGSQVLDDYSKWSVITGTITWGIAPVTYKQPIYEYVYFNYCQGI